jgi:hypothetical protein
MPVKKSLLPSYYTICGDELSCYGTNHKNEIAAIEAAKNHAAENDEVYYVVHIVGVARPSVSATYEAE